MNDQSKLNDCKGCSVIRRRGAACIVFLLVLSLFIFADTAEVSAAAGTFQVRDGKTYYVYADGHHHTGWLTIGTNKYYFYSTGKMATGWTKINGKLRYFRKTDGLMFRGIKKIGNSYYYFSNSSDPDRDGAKAKGFVTVNKTTRYYLDPVNGKAHTGWLSANSKKYYCSNSGKLYTGLRKIDKYYYLFYSTGPLCENKQGLKKIGNYIYYVKDDGHCHIGFTTINDQQYYFDSEGRLLVNATFTVDDVLYTSDSNGVAKRTSISGSAADNCTYNYEVKSSGGTTYVLAHDKNGRNYYVVNEFLTHPGVADGKKSDLDLLAAIAECEAGDQGLVGMEAVVLCILNRTLAENPSFPSEIRYVLYQTVAPSVYPQYSPVRGGTLLQRLNGNFYNKALAYQAAQNAMNIFKAYTTNKTARYLPGFDRKDFNFLYFMTVSSYRSIGLNDEKADIFWYKIYDNPNLDHIFFVNWA